VLQAAFEKLPHRVRPAGFAGGEPIIIDRDADIRRDDQLEARSSCAASVTRHGSGPLLDFHLIWRHSWHINNGRRSQLQALVTGLWGTRMPKPSRQRKSSGRMASKGYPNPIDIHVGKRIRLRRTLLGISQVALAEVLGITFQQVQKYESGANRVSSSRLLDLANVLDVDVSYFFQEMGADVQKQTPALLMNAKKLPDMDQEKDPMARRETMELVRAYYRIVDPAIRKRLADMVKTVAKGGE
jgi:transcriptional regulator with XRE-family HTH domain